MLIQRVRTFLQLVAIAHIVGGLLLPFVINTQLFEVYNAGLYAAIRAGSADAQSQARFFIGLFGPTIASWGILFWYVLTTSFKAPSARSWWVMVLAVIVWAPYDSLLSLWHGIQANAWVDLAVTAVILIPLLLVKKHFFDPNSQK